MVEAVSERKINGKWDDRDNVVQIVFALKGLYKGLY